MVISGNLSINRYEWAASLINTTSLLKPIVFDIGARDAIMLNYITDKINYKGYDLVPHNEAVEKWNLDDENKANENKADYILFLEVVEHLENPWNAIKNLVKTLKPNGTLILTTPNPFWSETRLSMFNKGIMTCFTIEDLLLNGHVFTPWPHIIKQLLEDNGLVIETYVTLDGKTELFDKNLIKNPFRIFKRIFKRILEITNKQSCGMSYGIIARKK